MMTSPSTPALLAISRTGARSDLATMSQPSFSSPAVHPGEAFHILALRWKDS